MENIKYNFELKSNSNSCRTLLNCYLFCYFRLINIKLFKRIIFLKMDPEQALKNLAMQNEFNVETGKVEPAFHYFAHKAGMQGVDKEKVAKIIADASKNSRYYLKQMEKKQKYEQQIAAMKEKIEKFWKDKQYVKSVQVIVDKKLHELEKERILSRTWVHFDLDMFFVAVEIRDNPELKDKPVAVGGMAMISTANYIARQYGVRSAMPGFIAKRLCPELVLINGNFQKYEETSRKFKAILEEYDPDYDSAGLDEAALDITNYLNENGITKEEDIMKLCHNIRMRINEATGITCSCGIGPNKMLAKLSTEINKPNGQYLMKSNREEIMNFLAKLPIRKIPGIGSQSEQLLNGLGIKTCSDILNHLPELYVAFTENAFEFFLRSALGLGRCYHELPEERKSVSVSRTFPVISKVEDMEKKIHELAGMVSEDLKHYKKKAKHITLIVKTHNFDVRNHGTPLDKYTNDEKDIENICLKMLKELLPLDPLRLMGIKAAQLMNESELVTLESFFTKQQTNNKNNSLKSEQSASKGEGKENQKLPSIVVKQAEESKQPVTSTTVTPIASKENSNMEMETKKGGNLTKDNVLGTNQVVCPICNKKFESSVNLTRINNHIDKCLMTMGNANSDISNQNSNTNMTTIDNHLELKTYEENNELQKGNYGGLLDPNVSKNKTAPKRKAQDDVKKNDSKKTKKTIDTGNTMKLDSFFKKK